MATIARRAVLILACLGAIAHGAAAQTSQLQQLRSSVPQERMRGFYALLYPDGSDNAGLRAHAAQLASLASKDDGLAKALIALAAREQREAPRAPGSISEESITYLGDLICVVAALEDPRALPVLLSALPTGGLAADGLIALGDTAVPELIGRSSSPDASVRHAAVLTLGKMAALRAGNRLSDRSRTAIRSALLGALLDPDSIVRAQAAAWLRLHPPK